MSTRYLRVSPGTRPGSAAILLVWTIALLGPVLWGCAMSALLTGRFEEPEITLADSKVETISSTTVRLSFGLDIFNPNSYGLQLRVTRYRLIIGGTVMAQGGEPVAVSLPAHGKATVHLPADVAFEVLQSTAHAAMMTGEIPYQLEAWFQVGNLLRTRQLSFVDSSVLRLNLPLGLARSGGLAVAQADWQS
jgi:LEA14-like dessication related protein